MASLLNIEEDQIRKWLCYRKIITARETFVKPMKMADALFARDALAKAIYAKLFDWIVVQINRSLKRKSGKSHKVWQLTQFFSVSFLSKLIDLLGGQITDPQSGKHYSLPFLLATPLSPSRTLEGLFELTQRPSRALDSPCAMLPELYRYKDTARCAALGAEVPGQRLPTTVANLDCAFV